MYRCNNNKHVNLVFIMKCLLISLIIIIILNIIIKGEARGNSEAQHEPPTPSINIGIILTNTDSQPQIKHKFSRCILSLTQHSSASIQLYLFGDAKSQHFVEVLFNELHLKESSIKVIPYDLELVAKEEEEQIQVLQKYFSSSSGSYYSQALFFLSTVLHRILPDVDRILLLDTDIEFRADVNTLYEKFDSFTGDQVIGIAPELNPVYRHILYMYRLNNTDTLLGSPQPDGYQGYNSGVLLLHLNKLRTSHTYNNYLTEDTIKHLVSKYGFRGHLGDQDLYTLIGCEAAGRQLFYELECNWNRQLCTWWRDHGYNKVFDEYFYCHGDVHIYHGNCNTDIPT